MSKEEIALKLTEIKYRNYTAYDINSYSGNNVEDYFFRIIEMLEDKYE